MSSARPAASYPKICDNADVVVGVLQNAYDVVLTDQLITSSTGQEVLDFNIPFDAPERSLIVNEKQIIAGGSKFRVRTLWDGWDQNSKQRITSVHCEALWYADLGEATPIVIVATNATTALSTILTGTGWSVGTVNPTTGLIAVLEFTNPLAVLRLMPQSFGGELVFDSTNKVVHLLTHRGSSTPVAVFGKGKNLAGNSRNADTTDLVTRLYVVGGTATDPVTGNQTTVNLRTVNGGLDYIEDYSYYDGLGLTRKIRSAVATADTITDPAKLLAWGQSQLAILAKPAFTYNVQQTNTGANDAVPVLGDVVRVHDTSLGMDALARVETRTMDLLYPNRTVYSVGTAAYNISNANVQTLDPVTVDSTTAIPNPPTSAVISTQHATATDGTSMMAVLASWTQVTANTDGTPASIQSYRIEWQVNGASRQPLEVSGVQASAMLGIVSPGVTAGMRIAAVSYAGVQSAWAIAGDTAITTTATVPDQPSAPVLDTTSAPGVIIVSWDGLNSLGNPMLANFLRTEVHVSTSSGFTPSPGTRVDSLFGPGRVPIGSVTYGTPYYVKLITLNTDLIAGPASVQATATPRQLVNTDVLMGTLDAARIATDAITADKLSFGSFASSMVPNGSFEDPPDAAAAAGVIAAGWQTNTTATRIAGAARSGGFGINLPANAAAGLVSDPFPVQPGGVLAGVIWAKTSVASGAGFTYRLQFYDTLAHANSQTSPTNGDFVAGAATTTVFQQFSGSVTVPAGMQYARALVYSTAQVAQVDDADVRVQIVAAQIGDAQIVTAKIASLAVTAAQIANATITNTQIANATILSTNIGNAQILTANIGNLQVNSAKISDLDVGKITSGIIASAQIQLNGGKLTTSALSSGARVEFDSAGIRGYNSSGTQLFGISATTGAFFAIGSISTAQSGQRIELTTTSVDRINLWSGVVGETPGFLQAASLVGTPYVQMQSGRPSGSGRFGAIQLQGGVAASGAVIIWATDNTGSNVSNLSIGGDGGASFTGVGGFGVNGPFAVASNSPIDLTASGGTDFSTDISGGDKIALFGGTIGLGVQSNRLVAYVPSAAALAVQLVAASGQKSNNTTNYRPVLASAFTVNSLGASKTRIRDIPEGEASDLIDRLRPVVARSHNDNHLPTEMQDRYFLVAEEVAQASPRLAGYEPTAEWAESHMHKIKPPRLKADDLQLIGNDLGAFVPVLVQALKETRAELAELRELVEAKQ